MITILQICSLAILIYFVVLCSINLLLVCLGVFHIRDYNHKITASNFDRIAKSNLSLPISVIIPAHNEAAIIIGTVENILKLIITNFISNIKQLISIFINIMSYFVILVVIVQHLLNYDKLLNILSRF